MSDLKKFGHPMTWLVVGVKWLVVKDLEPILQRPKSFQL
jgi:hypothetical protein